MPRLAFASAARADLRDIARSIARDAPRRAVTFVGELEATCRSVAAHPLAHPAREGAAPGLRVAVHRPYLILYRPLPGEDGARVLRIVHGARDARRLTGLGPDH